jgi:hypothetical protein
VGCRHIVADTALCTCKSKLNKQDILLPPCSNLSIQRDRLERFLKEKEASLNSVHTWTVLSWDQEETDEGCHRLTQFQEAVGHSTSQRNLQSSVEPEGSVIDTAICPFVSVALLNVAADCAALHHIWEALGSDLGYADRFFEVSLSLHYLQANAGTRLLRSISLPIRWYTVWATGRFVK